MSSPESKLDVVVDESTDDATRTQAIEALETANECDSLAELVTNPDLEDRFKERALTSLGHPQCKSMLEKLVEGGDLPKSHRKQAEELLEEVPDTSGAGP